MAVQPKPDCHKSYSVKRSVGRRLLLANDGDSIAVELLPLLIRKGSDIDNDALAIHGFEVTLGTLLRLIDGDLVASEQEETSEVGHWRTKHLLIERRVVGEPIALFREFGNSAEDCHGDLEILATLVTVSDDRQHGIDLTIELTVANHNDRLFELVEGDHLTINELEGQTFTLPNGVQFVQITDVIRIGLVGLLVSKESTDEERLFAVLQSDGFDPSVRNVAHNVRN